MWKHISFLDAKPIIKYYDDQVVELVIIIVPDDIQFSALDGCVTAFPPAFNLITQTCSRLVCVITFLRIVFQYKTELFRNKPLCLIANRAVIGAHHIPAVQLSQNLRIQVH